MSVVKFKIKPAITSKVRVYLCDDCGKPLNPPVESTSLYVLRGNEPRLICVGCVKPTDLYIWGNINYLDMEVSVHGKD